MIVLLQRVKQASVHVGEELVGECGRGLLAFFCAQQGDAPETAKHLADRMIKLRIFEDEAGKMNLSVKDVGGSLLLVSQFTLAADTKKAIARALVARPMRKMASLSIRFSLNRLAPAACLWRQGAAGRT